jgi:hypothetical protein
MSSVSARTLKLKREGEEPEARPAEIDVLVSPRSAFFLAMPPQELLEKITEKLRAFGLEFEEKVILCG